jgi:hypothetical protein
MALSSLLLTGGWALATAAVPGTQPVDRPMIFSVNPVGNGDFVGAPHKGSDFVRYDELLFEKASEAGSRSARVLASWREVEADKGKWDWEGLDREIELCRKYQIEPVVLICNIPAWVSPTGKPAHDHPPKDEYAPDFDNFITRLAQRYKGKAHYYEFWNEENGCSWINKGCDNAHMAHTYLPWLRRCYKAIKAMDADAQVAIGGLDDVQGHAPIFLEDCYRVRAEQYAKEKFWDAIAEHPYDSKPSEDTGEVERKLNAIRAITRKYGDAGIPIWITEYGWNAQETSLEAQRRGTAAFLEWFSRPDQKDIIIAQELAVADFEPVNLGYGLCDLNLRPRPAFQEFQQLARAKTPFPLSTGYRIQPDGILKVEASLVSLGSQQEPPCRVEIFDQQGEKVASAQAPNCDVEQAFPKLPPDTPFLASITPLSKGGQVQPVGRVPIIVPEGLVPNAGFESLFRAGVPWGWKPVGQAICRDGGPIGPQYRHGGEHSLLLVLFDNAKERLFDDSLQVPVRAARGDRFTAHCFARYAGPKDSDEALVLFSANLMVPDTEITRLTGKPVGREWTDFAMEVTAPCDSPVLEIHAVSERLPKGRWLLCVDDVSLTPIGR